MADSTNSRSYTLFICVSSVFSGAVSYIFYKLYKSRSEAAEQFRHIFIWHPDIDLVNHLDKQDNHYDDYAGVEGVIKALGRVLSSHYGKEEGVIIRSRIVEHKSKLQNGMWIDMKRVLKDNVEMVPFAVVKENNGDTKYKVEVTRLSEALLLENELLTTYDRFEENKYTLERLFGEFTKGIQVTEQMLLTGTNILGVGKIFLEKGEVKLGPPDDFKRSYILTRLRLRDLVDYYESQSTNYKAVSIVAAFVCGCFLGFAIYRQIATKLEERRQRLEFQELRRAIAEQRQQSRNIQNQESIRQVLPAPVTESDDNAEQQSQLQSIEIRDAAEEQPEDESNLKPEDTCVVCLVHARQLITLPCGHYAICSYCAEALPSPKRCPICRSNVERFIPVFHS